MNKHFTEKNTEKGKRANVNYKLMKLPIATTTRYFFTPNKIITGKI